MRAYDTPGSRHESVLIIRAMTPAAYDNLRHWLACNAQSSSVGVLGHNHVAHLGSVLAGHLVYAVPWRRLPAMIKRYETVVVLCVGDEEVTTGSTIHRVLSELLFSKRIILIGPHAIQAWPGGHVLFTPRRAREIAALIGATAIGLFTIVVTLGVILLYEMFMRLRRRR